MHVEKERRRERIVASRSDYSADHNDLCDDKTMLKMQREQRKRADKENRERRCRVFWTTEKPIKITCTIFQRKKKIFEKRGRSSSNSLSVVRVLVLDLLMSLKQGGELSKP
uniref:IBB domain-containing protein n=1 Tax=Brassica campestris TaxID=3711 RepID=M4EQ67_BRACM